MTTEAIVQDKQITIDVPADRVAEFYAFYGHFLAGPLHRRGRGRRHRCGGHHEGHHAPHAGEEVRTA